MNAGQIISVIETAYVEYRDGWGIQGTEGGSCLAIVEELVAHGLATDTATGEASLEARINHVLDGYIVDHDGRVHSNEFAAEVAVELGLVTADDALEVTG